MNLNYLLTSDIISIISLIFVIILAIRNTIIYEKKNRFYVGACIFTIIIIILEIIDRYLASVTAYSAVNSHIFVNVLGFSLIPSVPFTLIFAYYNYKNKFYNFLLLLPIVFNFIICFISGFHGWVFSVDANNLYSRGPLFMIPVIIAFMYFFFLIVLIKRSTIDYGKDEKVFLWSIFFMTIGSFLIQIVFSDIYIVWSTVALALVLYYIFMRDFQIKYDSITGIKNRFAYEYDIKKYKNNENVAIVMFDLNNLKLINDNNGHCNGDKVINASARIIKYSFKEVGTPYRIGGDEFCVICRNVSKKIIEDSLSQLTAGLSEINNSSNIKIGLAFGYSLYTDRCKSIYDVIELADAAMYKHKAKLKMDVFK